MTRLTLLFFALLFLAFFPALGVQGAMPLQPWFDTALPGAIIRLPPGTYQGPAVISKPLTLEGEGKVIIDAGGKGELVAGDAAQGRDLGLLQPLIEQRRGAGVS